LFFYFAENLLVIEEGNSDGDEENDTKNLMYCFEDENENKDKYAGDEKREGEIAREKEGKWDSAKNPEWPVDLLECYKVRKK
jgi:hypothetical protein